MKKIIILLMLLYSVTLRSQVYDFSNIQKNECTIFTSDDTNKINGNIDFNSVQDINNYYSSIIIYLLPECRLTTLEKNGGFSNLKMKFKQKYYYSVKTDNFEFMFWEYPHDVAVLFIRSKYHVCIIKRTFKFYK